MSEAMQYPDPAAAERLWTEVQRTFGTGRVTSKNALSKATGIGRTTLDNWLLVGIQPTVVGMQKIAEALGVTPESLWLRWLGLAPPQDHLRRIAEALERAYPLPAEQAEGEARGRKAARELQSDVGTESHAKRHVPPETTGSAS